ncbi:MAG: IS200/IS605 family transposase [Bacteroidota bacterium]
MAQSLAAIYIHCVFRTKHGDPHIHPRIEEKLHAYIAGILKKLGSPAIKINSMPDHIHLLFRNTKNRSLAEVIQLVKKDSSKWMKSKGFDSFRWQNGYGAFSVSQSKVEIVKKYIQNQKPYHHKKGFMEEVELFMKEYEIEEYSKEYFWK